MPELLALHLISLAAMNASSEEIVEALMKGISTEKKVVKRKQRKYLSFECPKPTCNVKKYLSSEQWVSKPIRTHFRKLRAWSEYYGAGCTHETNVRGGRERIALRRWFDRDPLPFCTLSDRDNSINSWVSLIVLSSCPFSVVMWCNTR